MANEVDSEGQYGENSLSEYVDDELFGDTFDSLGVHIDRKKALANEDRYALLYLLTKETSMTLPELQQHTDYEEEALQDHLDKLATVNLIAEVPAPDKHHTYYRITTLGRQEIESDIYNISG